MTSTTRTARCGPACRVVWEGNGQVFLTVPYPDTLLFNNLRILFSTVTAFLYQGFQDIFLIMQIYYGAEDVVASSVLPLLPLLLIRNNFNEYCCMCLSGARYCFCYWVY